MGRKDDINYGVMATILIIAGGIGVLYWNFGTCVTVFIVLCVIMAAVGVLR